MSLRQDPQSSQRQAARGVIPATTRPFPSPLTPSMVPVVQTQLPDESLSEGEPVLGPELKLQTAHVEVIQVEVLEDEQTGVRLQCLLPVRLARPSPRPSTATFDHTLLVEVQFPTASFPLETHPQACTRLLSALSCASETRRTRRFPILRSLSRILNCRRRRTRADDMSPSRRDSCSPQSDSHDMDRLYRKKKKNPQTEAAGGTTGHTTVATGSNSAEGTTATAPRRCRRSRGRRLGSGR